MTDMNVYEDESQAPIGVFDSGVGGLTVAREIMRQMPNERIIYFGDTARVPYGNKSKETITRFSKQIARFLQSHQVKTIVVACNTASAYAIEELEAELDIPVIGVVKPGARMAADITRNGKIGVIATEGTIGSGLYTKYIKSLREDATIYGKACPLFVPLVEEGLWEDPVTVEIARRYLNELIDLIEASKSTYNKDEGIKLDLSYQKRVGMTTAECCEDLSQCCIFNLPVIYFFHRLFLWEGCYGAILLRLSGGCGRCAEPASLRL